MPALRHKLGTKKGVAGNVPARRGKACDKTVLNRIAHRLGDDWDRARRRLCRKRWRCARGDDDVDVQAHEFRRETGEAIEVRRSGTRSRGSDRACTRTWRDRSETPKVLARPHPAF